MRPAAPSPFVLTPPFVFRRSLPLRRHVTPCAPAAPEPTSRARKHLKKQAKDARLRDFFGWCEGCGAYASIF